MTVKDTVNRSILRYPTLYLDKKSYENAKFWVLHQYFIVLGNGIEWANTKDPKKGGYLLEMGEGTHKKVNDEWERMYDKPYGKVTIGEDVEQYFTKKVYKLSVIDHEGTKKWAKIMKPLKSTTHGHIQPDFSNRNDENLKKRVFLKNEFDLLPHNTLLPGTKYNESYKYFLHEVKRESSDERRSPYPNFSKQFSCFWEKGMEYIKDDWREEAIIHLEHWQKYFADPNQLINYSHYPKPGDLKKHIETYYFAKNKSIKEVAKDYKFPNFDGTNYEELEAKRWKKQYADITMFLSETINKLKK